MKGLTSTNLVKDQKNNNSSKSVDQKYVLIGYLNSWL